VVSTLKLTKIQIPNSDSDVISLDASTGNITLNKTLGGTSITVQGEGTATTNLQQGIVKFWMQMSAGQTVYDSFNSSGLTDNGTGDYTVSFNNDMANATYAAHHTATDANTNTAVLVGVTKGSSFATGSLGVYVLNEDTGTSDGSDPSSISVLGDLA
tara:strand:- start:26 stop:496 length:471 start_codon:yes stop_codon:yes gene_type:complete